MVATMLGIAVLSPLLPRIIATVSITSFEAGIALSIMWGLAAVFQYPGGRASDQLSRKTVLIAALGVIVLGSLLLSQAATYPGFVIGTALIGVGGGLYWPTAFAHLSDLFVARRGQAFGINAAAGDVGGILASGLAGIILFTTVWRRAFVPVAVFAGLVAVLVHRWSREPYAVDRVDLGLRETAGHLFRAKRIRRVLVVYALIMFVFQGTVSFLPTFLQVEKGFTPGLANATFSLLFVSGIVSKPIVGRIGDRLGHATVSAGVAVVAATGLTAALTASIPALVIGAVVVFALGFGALFPLVITYLMDRFPDASMGGDLGGLRTVAYAIASVGPAYVGFVAERLSYTVAFGGFVVCIVSIVGIMAWVAQD